MLHIFATYYNVVSRSSWDWHTYSNILKVPANFFDVDAAVERHPATSEKPAAAQCSLNVNTKTACNLLASNNVNPTNILKVRFFFFSWTNLRSGWGSDKQTRRKPGYRRQSWERQTNKKVQEKIQINQSPQWVYNCRSIYTAMCVQLTAIISALEMVGAMLRMNREQVRWRGRGLGESSLGFFSSFLSSSTFSFGFSSSSLEEREGTTLSVINTGNSDFLFTKNRCYD